MLLWHSSCSCHIPNICLYIPPTCPYIPEICPYIPTKFPYIPTISLCPYIPTKFPYIPTISCPYIPTVCPYQTWGPSTCTYSSTIFSSTYWFSVLSQNYEYMNLYLLKYTCKMASTYEYFTSTDQYFIFYIYTVQIHHNQ